MNGGPRIIPIDAGQPDNGGSEPVLDLRAEAWPAPETFEQEDETPPARREWPIPAAASFLVVAWTAFFGWANLPAMRVATLPTQWAQWIVAWSVPVLLVLVGLLLVMRTSRREATRFSDVARSLATESERLEVRLRSTNTELSLARDFIASQSRDLESLGRVAVDRLSGSAGRLQELIVGNGAQVDRIGEVSGNALENMEKLRGQLPVIANSAKDVTNTIANAGRTAHVQLEDMIAGFQRLNEFGVASERQVVAIRERVDAALAAFGAASDRIGTLVADRFDALASETEAHRQKLDGEEIAALAAIRARADVLAQELEQHRSLTAEAENEALAALRSRSDALRQELARHRGASSEAEGEALAALRSRSDALAQQIAQQRSVIAAAEEEMLAALHARFASLRDESGAIGRTLTQSEDAALAAFAVRSAGEVNALRQAIEEIGRDHDGLLAASRERLAGFEENAQALTRRLIAEAGEADAEIARRRGSLELAMAEQREALSRRLVELDRSIGERRTTMAAAGAEAAEALARKLAELDHAIEEQRKRQIDDARLLGNHCDAIGERVVALSTALRASGDQGAETAATVDRSIGALNQRLVDMRDALTGTDGQIVELTTSAVRLLELIQAGGDHTRTQIPEALRSTEAGLGMIEDRVVALRDTLREAGDSGRSLSEQVGTTRGDVAGVIEDIGGLHRTLAEHAAQQQSTLDALRNALTAARADSDALSQDIEARLSGAVSRLAEAAGHAGDHLRETTAREIEGLAEQLGEQSSAAIVRVLQGRGAELIGRLEEAIDSAAAASRETAMQMRDQLSKVDELAGNLENRVTRARERAEELVDNDFARRTALITESLNSTSIDIAKALSSDVSETAWASYLRGDRGIFTRRAVSLLDSAEAKAVQQHYESEPEFREHVNRYIHDFESMLRQLLSTRDGNALGVTLLSSDMGKLYVALAQGIERLRT